MSSGWIAVDLDGTLATDVEPFDVNVIGAPIPTMVARVKEWLAKGIEVRIFTARVCKPPKDVVGFIEQPVEVIENWCVEHLGQKLIVTNEKDYGTMALWDDRAISVESNTGRITTKRLNG